MQARRTARLLVAALLLSLAGCSSTGSPPASSGPSLLASATVTVSDAWVRAAASIDAPTAGYVTITNGGAQDDALLGAASPAATSVEVHETTMDSSGMAGMHPVDRVTIAARSTVKLEPGGYHMMMTGLAKPLKAGDTVELELTFEDAGKVVVQAQVRQG